MQERDYPRLLLPKWFDEAAEYETPIRGYLSCAEVELESGNRYKVNFIDSVRLQQNLESEIEAGRPYFAEPGLIVLPEVTVESAKTAIARLLEDGFFNNLRPL